MKIEVDLENNSASITYSPIGDLPKFMQNQPVSIPFEPTAENVLEAYEYLEGICSKKIAMMADSLKAEESQDMNGADHQSDTEAA